MKKTLVGALVAVSLSACPEKKAADEHAAVAVTPAPAADAGIAHRSPAQPVQVLLFVTGAENGYLLATPDDAALRGGAAEFAARVSADGHCIGPLGAQGEPACPGDTSILFSTGDNANGQAISSYFKGESTAQVMNALGYAASALGNREFDWPREQFLKNAAIGRFASLSANVQAVTDEARALSLKPYRVLTRAGVKIGVIGLSSRKATVTPMPGRMAGLQLVPDEVALDEAVKGARAEGATILAVTTDGCLNEVAPLVQKHTEWQLALVAGRKCEVEYPETVGLTRFVYPGRHFNNYVKAVVTADAAATGPAQLFSVEATTVDVVSAPGAAKVDETVAGFVTEWKKKLDAALGGQIGFTAEPIEQESVTMSRWLTTAMREYFKTDVALLNRKGVRQTIPAGRITKASIYDAIPFDNQVVVLKLTGEALIAALGNVEARAAGVKSRDDGFVDDKGKPIDPKRIYTVATTDYLAMGGDGFTLNAADPAPKQTGVSWQASLIGWTEGRKSTQARPLDAMLNVK